MIKHFLFLQIVLLTAAIRESLAGGPSITGRPNELNDERGQRLRGALQGRQNRGNLPTTATKTGKIRGLQGYWYSTSSGHPPTSEGWPADSSTQHPPSGGGYYPPPPTGDYVPPPPPPEYGYYPPKSGSSSSSSKGGGMGMGMSRKGGGIHFPKPEEIPMADHPTFPDDFFSDDDCKLVTFNESFYFMGPVASDPVSDDAANVGSRFIFNNEIMQPDSTVVEGVVLAGVCTRTAPPGLLGTDGAGTCDFTCYDTGGNWSITTSGYVRTVKEGAMSAGNLVVTGGSGEMVSVIGEMNVIPMDDQGMLSTGDIFTEAFAYYVEAAYGLIICPEPYYITSDITP